MTYIIIAVLFFLFGFYIHYKLSALSRKKTKAGTLMILTDEDNDLYFSLKVENMLAITNNKEVNLDVVKSRI